MPKTKVKINVKDRLEDNVLDLSLSEIEDIPVKEIAAVRRATVLDLSSNNIKFIPKNFGTHLAHLYRIDLSKNQLRFLPDDFGNLASLKHLDLYNNQLENLPVTFGKLAKLKYLDLKGNPLSPALQKIVGPCLTGKDCQDAARNVVPYHVDLAKKLEVELRKKAEREAKEQELEAERQREEKRLAKKAARKERVMLERQRQAEEEERLLDKSKPNADRSTVADEIAKGVKDKSVVQSSSSPSMSVLKLIKSFLLISILLMLLCALVFKFLPTHFTAISTLIPANQRQLLSSIFESLDKSLGRIISPTV